MTTEEEKAQARAYKRAWYARQKAADTPIYRRLLARQRLVNARREPALLWWATHRPAPRPPVAPPRVQLLCCGVWQAVTAVPFACAYCGRQYLAPAAKETHP